MKNSRFYWICRNTHKKNRDNFKDVGATIKPCQHTHSQSFENWGNSCRRNTGNCDSSMRKPDKSALTYILDSSSTEVFYLSEVLCRANVEYEMSNWYYSLYPQQSVVTYFRLNACHSGRKLQQRHWSGLNSHTAVSFFQSIVP